MERIEINTISKKDKNVVILIFTEGTILKPKKWIHYFIFKKYIPIKNCISKIYTWERQGAEIVYLTSRRGNRAYTIAKILKNFNLSGSFLYYRNKKEKYKDIVEQLQPDIFIEDDCRSIGGKWQTAINHVNTETKRKTTSIIVQEFKGIDELPDLLFDLKTFRQ
jgi:hypothetical protein